MLFLLLVVWLARSPIALAASRLLMIFVMISVIAISSPATSAIAEDRYERNKGPAAFRPAASNHQKAELLREGTLIPPTVGRIVMLGRRWAFIPDGVEAKRQGEDLVQPSSRRGVASVVGFKGKPRPTRLGAASRISLASPGSISASPDSICASPDSINASPDSIAGAILARSGTPKGNTFHTPLPQVLVVENLMLQRIAEAIRADGSDDHWTVSGAVTEFFNENQLLIRTAQRAGSR